MIGAIIMNGNIIFVGSKMYPCAHKKVSDGRARYTKRGAPLYDSK